MSKYRFALTGTPIEADPSDLWPIMHGLAPEEYPSRTKYIDRYCINTLNNWGALEILGLRPETADEFHRILDPRFLRRVKKGVTPVLDPRPVEMGAKQAKAYKQMVDHMLALLDSGLLTAEDPLVRGTRLRQMACALPVLDDDGNVVALSEPSCKVDGLLDVLDEAPGEPLVVFAESRKLIELCAEVLARKKVEHIQITGTVQAEQRAYNVEQFQAGETQVALCTIAAGSEGITLNRADRCLFLQRGGSAIKNKQAQARIDPIGEETGAPLIIDLITVGTVEASVHANGAEKAIRLDEITRDRQRLAAFLQGSAAA